MCPKCKNSTTDVVKRGFYKVRSARGRVIQRYLCRRCGCSFSDQTGSLTYRERKPRLTQEVMRFLMEGVSQRGCARLLRCSPATVARKLVRLGVHARLLNKARTSVTMNGNSLPVTTVVFDEMETFEHSKCKPVAIALAVDQSTRMIIAAEVAIMPSKKPLKHIARRRYGDRRDERSKAMIDVLAEVKRLCPSISVLKSDQCPRYPNYVAKVFSNKVEHRTFKGRKACIVGQGELKRGGWDPLFMLNHTCAMYRDRVKRLARRTWTTTKRVDRLAVFVQLYAWWHNQYLSNRKSIIKMPKLVPGCY